MRWRFAEGLIAGIFALQRIPICCLDRLMAQPTRWPISRPRLGGVPLQQDAMETRRIHLTGASGSGVTMLGRALAQDLSAPHHDTDDFFWVPTNPPYRERRPIAERLGLIEALFLPRPDWVLSGSLRGWGDPLVSHLDIVIFVSARTEVRLKRLREREQRRYSREAIAPGGSNHQAYQAFIDWASHYDDDHFDGRSRTRHEAWLQTLPCPVIRVDGERKLDDLRNEIISELGRSLRLDHLIDR